MPPELQNLGAQTGTIDIDIDIDDAPPPASPPSPPASPPSPASERSPPAWKQTAVDEVGLGAGIHRVGGASRVEVAGGVPAERRSQERPGRVEERVVKQSVRFGESFDDGPTPLARPAEPPEPAPNVVMDPWDEIGGPAVALDLDKSEPPPSPFAALVSQPPPQEPEPEPAPAPEQEEDQCEALMRGARELFELGDFSGSLDLVEKVLKIDAENVSARAYMQRNEATLVKMYESKLGDMGRTPRQLMPPDEVIWMNMHHKAGFLLSQVDGQLSFEDLLVISGMPRFDTMRILADLVQQGIIG